MAQRHLPALLIIMDGFGHREETKARTPSPLLNALP